MSENHQLILLSTTATVSGAIVKLLASGLKSENR